MRLRMSNMQYINYNINMIIIKLDDLMWHQRTTAEDIVKATGLGSTTISKLRNSKNINISLNTLDKLCDYFNCNVSDILEHVSKK